MLLYGRRPQRYVPLKSVHCVRYVKKSQVDVASYLFLAAKKNYRRLLQNKPSKVKLTLKEKKCKDNKRCLSVVFSLNQDFRFVWIRFEFRTCFVITLSLLLVITVLISLKQDDRFELSRCGMVRIL